MKQNPCRYCALAIKIPRLHSPSYREECNKCEYLKAHKDYLKSKRKFSAGDKIKNFTELIEQTWVFWGNRDKPMHIEAVKSLQLRIVLRDLESGNFYKAIKKKEE